MASTIVEPTYVFGLKGDVSENICHLDEQNVIYPAGSSVIVYNIQQKTQRFIHGTEGSQGITAIAVSPNRRYVAVAEKAEHASVTIYDLHSLKKRKFLSDPSSECSIFVCMRFSPDSKYLVTLGGAPEWFMHYWAWEKSQGPMAITKCSLDPDVAVYRVTFNPQDNTHLCVTGNNTLKMFRYTEGNFKQLAFQKVDSQDYLSQCWLAEDAVACGTASGKIFLFIGGELKAELSTNERITAVASLNNGFVCGTGSGSVIVFEATDDDELYNQTREYNLPSDISNTTQSIHCISISPSEDSLVCTTTVGQIYTLSLVTNESDILRGDEIVGLKLLSHLFHHSPITGLDVAVRKPLIATTGLDTSVRVWNYNTNSLELVKYFSEEAHSIAIHPSGLFVLVGFGDKLRLMSLLIDDVRNIREFSIRECKECRFSNGGHLFAAAQGNVIQVYSTWTFKPIVTLKGHSGRIRSLTWSSDDIRIVSCGVDGAVYEWSTLDRRRINEYVQKTCSYSSASLDSETDSIYAVGSDKTLKRIRNSALDLEVPASTKASSEIVLTQILASNSGKMLFGATAQGAVRCYKVPLELKAEWMSTCTHFGCISRLCISPDDCMLFSVGNDGCLFIHKLVDKEGRVMKRRNASDWSDEILITKSDLQEKNSLTSELKRRVEELQMASEYQLRLKDMNYNEKLKEITDKFTQEKEDLKRQLHSVKAEKEKEENRHNEEIESLNDRQLQEIQELEHQHNQKLMNEYEKYQGLQKRSQEMQSDYEIQLEQMAASKESALKDLAEYWENKLREKTAMLEAANEAARDQQRENEETVRQIEIDADKEILAMRLNYEKTLREEREHGLEVKGENGILLKKFKALQKEIEEEQQKRTEMQAEQKKLHAHIKALEREIVSGKKEIEERDETIQDKERRIYDLKKKNQELEKFKFVLDYKIKELKKQIEPKDQDIKAMKRQIAEMDLELERYHKTTNSLELRVSEIQSKLSAAEGQVKLKQTRVKFLENVISRVKSEIQAAVGLIQEPKALVDAVRELHRHHCIEMKELGTLIEEDIQAEHNRQRNFLERNIAALQKKVKRAEGAHEAEVSKIMQENVTLIKEINDLRKELKAARSHARKVEGTLKTSQTLSQMRNESITMDLGNQSVPATLKEIDETEQADRIITMQKDEIRRLRTTVKDLEKMIQARPPSSGRLPPMTTA